MDYFIIFIAVSSGLYFHWWLYVRIKRWTDRDLALSMAGADAAKRAYMLQRLAAAKAEGVESKQLAAWLEQAANDYQAD
ncbi:MAG: hypothetical protein Q8R10_17455 [Pseudomonas sp.]|uniref:hypothetical protein n=1 Tax=Pseudomonas sp. TaxID=306 RepID=UPI00273769B2|nr:hypothetical protein [Pseudomonas sp.]MDP3848205.1 hypothetical protein [Pseudomonas sp.]